MTDRPRAFAKAQACGNDFVLIDAREGRTDPMPDADGWGDAGATSLAVQMCRAKTGVGADGLLVLTPPTPAGREAGALLRMRIFNADGSEGRACGNGLRCVGAWLDKTERWTGSARVEVGQGVRTLRREGTLYATEMGEPGLNAPNASPEGTPAEMSVVSMGNLHAIVWGEFEFSIPPLAEMRAMHESLEASGMGAVNLTRAQVVQGTIAMITREAGAGFTLSCGSASCAAACAAIAEGRVGPGQVEVRSPGGVARVRWAGPEQADARGCELIGPAEIVFSGLWRA